ncbi:hypothetical protein ACWEQ1_28315 [Streptomyces nodosus]
MTARFNQTAAEMLGAASVYNPDGMMQVGQDFCGLAEAYENIAEAMRRMAVLADEEFPLNRAITDQLKDMHAILKQVAAKGRELQPAFRNLHKDDVTRIANPR